MKIIEPLSSALLLTACVYSAGVAQSDAFMHAFGINPAFSQPSIDKIFYDGGLITFEIFYNHLKLIKSALKIALPIAFILAITTLSILFFTNKITASIQATKKIMPVISWFFTSALGVTALIYLIYLTFASFTKAQGDGERLALTFTNTCHAVTLKKDKDTIDGCAFRKDRDSIWYFTVEENTPRVNSKLLSEVDQISYLPPKEISNP